MKNLYLKPIDICKPPHHTLLQARCYSCKKFPVCNIREDYLKTSYLISNILGNPQKDFELLKVAAGDGVIFENENDVIPATITVKNHEDGVLVQARIVNKNYFNVIYEIESYLVSFIIEWNDIHDKYIVSLGTEIYYGSHFMITTESEKEISNNLVLWRANQPVDAEMDIINTTHFHCSLDCDFYEYDRTNPDQIQRMSEIVPPDDSYSHIETYHLEPGVVPPYNPTYHQTFCPLPAIDPIVTREDNEQNF